MSISGLMIMLAQALPEKSIGEVSLTFTSDGNWHIAAGGHPHVSLGEWQGDFYADGKTAEEAINICLQKIKAARP